MFKIKQIIQPYEVKGSLIRLGNQEKDGGYIVDQAALDRVDVLYSYGVGNDISFEEDFEKLTKKPILLYDFTVNCPKLTGNMKFKKEGLSGNKTHNCNNFLNHVKINKHNDKKIILKIDVEGSEIEWLENTDISSLSKLVNTFIIEFHNLSKDISLIEKIKEYYNIIWIHGNNSKYTIDGLPVIIEMTFVRKDIDIFIKPIKKKLPLSIDKANIINRKDIVIDYRPILN